MQLIEMVKKESVGMRQEIFIAAAISGIANAAVLAIINSASQLEDAADIKFRYLLMFGVAITLYVICLKYTYDKSSQVFESILSKVRIRLSEKIRNAELSSMETIGRAIIYDRLTRSTETISQSQQILVGSLQAAVLVCFTSLYIAYLSLPAFLLTVLMSGMAVGMYLFKDKETNSYINKTSAAEVDLVRAFTDLLNGFKQVKMRKNLGNELLDEISEISNRVRDLKIKTSSLYNNNNIFAMSFFYLLMAAIVFVLPRFIPTYHEVISELTAAILFIIGPLGLVVSGIPTFTKANYAARHIEDLENSLDKMTAKTAIDLEGGASPYMAFQEITCSNLEYGYKDKDGRELFHFGPIDLTIKRGEVVFIVGGNGSGKSTFMRLLTGLYSADSGEIRIDGERITTNNLQGFRELFSIIFGDFHLFGKLYGINLDSPDIIRGLIADMGLREKTSFSGDQFSNLDLSTGQRKRIALIVSILEQRPLLIYDEWAADQDPVFRQRFYTEIIPRFKREGKTVLAVTHDDHYFDYADRVIKFDYGKIDPCTSNLPIPNGTPVESAPSDEEEPTPQS